MTARENMLGRIRTALGRPSGGPPEPPPAVRLSVPEVAADEKVRQFCSALEKLAAKTFVAPTREIAGEYVCRAVGDQTVVMTGAPLLRECGLSWASVAPDVAGVGITSAEYGLADTGTLVVLSAGESRLASLLPPVHIAVIESSRILSGLDELLTVLPEPAEVTASMVLITGPSRTADIEQILVRGVHGPGELHVVVIM